MKPHLPPKCLQNWHTWLAILAPLPQGIQQACGKLQVELAGWRGNEVALFSQSTVDDWYLVCSPIVNNNGTVHCMMKPTLKGCLSIMSIFMGAGRSTVGICNSSTDCKSMKFMVSPESCKASCCSSYPESKDNLTETIKSTPCPNEIELSLQDGWSPLSALERGAIVVS